MSENRLSTAMKNDASLRQTVREFGEKYRNQENKGNAVVEFAGLLQSKGFTVTEEQINEGIETIKGRREISESELEKVSGGNDHIMSNCAGLECVPCVVIYAMHISVPPCF